MSKTLNESLEESLEKSLDENPDESINEIELPINVREPRLHIAKDGARGIRLLKNCLNGGTGYRIKPDDDDLEALPTYYIWDKEENVVWKAVKLNGDYALEDLTVSQFTTELRQNHHDENALMIGQLERSREPLNGWDKFVSFFGFKTARIKRNERIDKALRLCQDGYVREKMRYAGITEEDLLPKSLNAEEEEIMSLNLDGMREYVRTGKPPVREDVSRTSSLMIEVQPEPDENKAVNEEPEDKVEPISAAQALKIINTYAPALNTAYDHMMHSIDSDETVENKKELRTAAYVVCKFYNDKLVALKNGDRNVEFTGMEEGCIGYLSRCGNSSLVNVCKTVAGIVRNRPNTDVLNFKLNCNNIIGNEINKNAGLEKEDVYKPADAEKPISFPIKMDEIAEVLGK